MKELDVGCELENDINDENDADEHGCKSIDAVTEEALRDIGGLL